MNLPARPVHSRSGPDEAAGPVQSEGGDGRPALESLYSEHAAFVRDLMARLLGPGGDAEDQRQEVFLIAWRRLDTLRRGVPARAWLCGIALRVAAAARRRARLRQFLGLEQAWAVAGGGTPGTAFESAEASRLVYSILDTIAEKKRTAFILFEIQGLSGQEISEAMSCPPKTVRTRLFHARREFLRELKRRQDRERARLGERR